MQPDDQAILVTHQPMWLADWFHEKAGCHNLRQLVRCHLRGRARIHLAGRRGQLDCPLVVLVGLEQGRHKSPRMAHALACIHCHSFAAHRCKVNCIAASASTRIAKAKASRKRQLPKQVD